MQRIEAARRRQQEAFELAKAKYLEEKRIVSLIFLYIVI